MILCAPPRLPLAVGLPLGGVELSTLSNNESKNSTRSHIRGTLPRKAVIEPTGALPFCPDGLHICLSEFPTCSQGSSRSFNLRGIQTVSYLSQVCFALQYGHGTGTLVHCRQYASVLLHRPSLARPLWQWLNLPVWYLGIHGSVDVGTGLTMRTRSAVGARKTIWSFVVRDASLASLFGKCFESIDNSVGSRVFLVLFFMIP